MSFHKKEIFMKNYVSKRTLFSTLLAGFFLANPVMFAPIAGANTGMDADTPGASAAVNSSSQADPNQNVPDDQLALPITLKQFQDLQNTVQQQSQDVASAIDTIAAKQDEFAKKFDAWVNDLLNSSSSGEGSN